MFITDSPKKKFVKLTSKDPGWVQTDGLVIYPRAGVDINPQCPTNVVWLLQEAFQKGWVELSVQVPEKTLMWETLQK